jgi:hypothetical protein
MLIYTYTYVYIYVYIYIYMYTSNRAGGGGSCGYLAIFPATSPYVTAVGATQDIQATSKGAFNGAEQRVR